MPRYVRSLDTAIPTSSVASAKSAHSDSVGMAAAGPAVIDADDELLPGTGSTTAAEATVAVLVMPPAVSTRTMSVIVAVAEDARVPTLHVTVVVPLHVP